MNKRENPLLEAMEIRRKLWALRRENPELGYAKEWKELEARDGKISEMHALWAKYEPLRKDYDEQETRLYKEFKRLTDPIISDGTESARFELLNKALVMAFGSEAEIEWYFAETTV